MKQKDEPARRYLHMEIYNAVKAFAEKIGAMESEGLIADAFKHLPESITRGRMLAEIALDDVMRTAISVVSNGPPQCPPLDFYAGIIQLRYGGPKPTEGQTKTQLFHEYNQASQRDNTPLFVTCLQNALPPEIRMELKSMWAAVQLKLQGLKLTEAQLDNMDYTLPEPTTPVRWKPQLVVSNPE